MIRFENVTKYYQNGYAGVKSLNLNIQPGELFVLIGPSGSGKTTTLKMINRMVELSEGTLFINNKKISEYNIYELRWNIGYVFQQIALFPHMTIEENIAIVPELKKWDNQKIDARITELLESVGLEPESYRHRKPSELSGGEQQRVGVVRALAADPGIILMDEPFSALDPISRQKLQLDILMLQKKIKKTIVFVTHDMQEALTLGDRICIMQDGEVVQCDTPKEILANPKNEFVKNFFQSGNVYKKSILDGGYQVKDLLHWKFFSEPEAGDSELSISEDAAIEELIKLFSKEKSVSIVSSSGGRLGTVNPEQLIKFISLELEKGSGK